MERVILVLALLAGLHLVLSFLRWVVQTVQVWLRQKPEPTVTPAPVPEGRTDWRPYHLPACQRRNRIDPSPAKKGEASFEVIA
ncbi:MAG: hypothetical protein HT579_11915 [Candidatus Accumulibacter similis]|nr:MAG: hypothetical protein HT579_11915 [Candidatus Accumulibacter similis]